MGRVMYVSIHLQNRCRINQLDSFLKHCLYFKYLQVIPFTISIILIKKMMIGKYLKNIYSNLSKFTSDVGYTNILIMKRILDNEACLRLV